MTDDDDVEASGPTPKPKAARPAKGSALDYWSKVLGIATTILGGVWIALTFLAGEREKISLREQEIQTANRQAIASFAMDLVNVERREAAAFAVATLGGTEAVPILAHHLRAALRNEDLVFVDALVQALSALPDDAGVRELARLNRDARGLDFDAEQRVAYGTSAALWAAALSRADAGDRRDGGQGTSEERPLLAGATLVEVDPSYDEAEGVDLIGARLFEMVGCNVTLLRLKGERLVASDLYLEHSWLAEADFQEARFWDSRFEMTHLANANFALAFLSNVAFDHVDLSGATMTAYFSKTTFDASILENADFSGALFDGTTFAPAVGQAEGPVVWGATFDGAEGLSEEDRIYLCRNGASGVPGGCDGIEASPSADYPETSRDDAACVVGEFAVDPEDQEE